MALPLIAALILALAAPAEAPTEVAGAVVTPSKAPPAPVVVGDDHDWSYRPPNAEILSVWPQGAWEAQISGSATLSCIVNVFGMAEDCEVASETPQSRGFGKAALLLRNTFKLRPTEGPNGPIPGRVSVTIKFDAVHNDDIQFSLPSNSVGGSVDRQGISLKGTAPEMRAVMMLDHPIWAQAASFADLAKAYPAGGDGITGFAVAHCPVQRSGALGRCEVRKQSPLDHGFGTAAVALANHFRADLDGVVVPRGKPVWVDIPMRFVPPGGGPDHSVASPTWLAGLDPARAPKLFPPEAAATGLTTGLGMARCIVAADGALTHCTALPGDPDGLGFSEAAVKLASLMKMNPWTADGRPVDGAAIRLPIRLNLAAKK